MIYSTNYFGSIPYIQSIAQHKSILIDLFEVYKKQSWRNRTQIFESNGPLYLSVPVYRPNGSQTLVKDVLIDHKEDWRKDHWKAIESSYMHAPFFFYYGAQIRDLIYQDENQLYKFNLTILKQLLKWLDLDIQIALTEEYIPPKDITDYRISLDKKKFNLPQESYIQVFSDTQPFLPNLSILDLLMCEGPLARKFVL